ncbi:MAG: hypothetical protein JWN44_3754 [Myxococcales bacterium]|nr:hypothetical protein [Myxococcales bacterium]
MRARLAVILGCVFWSGTAQAFCGFFVAGGDSKLTNNASQVALLRKGNRTVMTMANNYQGPPESFAMVVPVPVVLQKQDVKTLPADVFDHIDSLSAPRLVEYWERDPCYVDRREMEEDRAPSAPMKKGGSSRGEGGLGVKVEAQFVVGEYEIVVLSAKDSGGLDKWLRLNNYKIPAGAAEALAPYVRDQMKFFVAKVDIHKVKRDANGTVQLSPLRFSFESNELRLPVRLGLLNANGKQDLIIYVLHPTSRFEVANYPNVFIPTNLDVVDAVRQSFASFYAELFDATMGRMQGKAVVTEYAWQTSSCDPCPVPPLQPSDLATLGDDASVAPAGQPMQKTRGGFYGNFASWVLTRLHTRYSKESLSEDLVFREARPVTGGRANYDGTSGDAGASVQAGGENNFQGRYIIRHYWSGAVKCDQPRYNVWGGPPDGGQPTANAAKGLATAERGKVRLPSVVRSPVPVLGIAGQPPPRRK